MSAILAICGPIGSGKGTISEYLEEKHDAYILNTPIILKELCGVLNIPKSRKNYQDMAVAIGNAFGGEWLLKPLLDRLPKPWPKLIVYDGIRYLAQDDYLKLLPGVNYLLISVDAPAIDRYQRMLRRQQYQDEAKWSWEEFDQASQHRIEQDIEPLMERSTFHLDNSGTQEHLLEQLQPVISLFV